MKSPLTREEWRKVMLDAAGDLGRLAQAKGVLPLLKPLNCLETDFMHTPSTGIEICREFGHRSLKVMSDLHHMNIEEDHPNRSLREAGDMLARVHVCDGTRAEPRAGHIDFAAAGEAPRSIGYGGNLALECGLRADPETALRDTVALCTGRWAEAERAPARPSPRRREPDRSRSGPAPPDRGKRRWLPGAQAS